MSGVIGTNKSSFVIYGSGYDVTSPNSGEGEVPTGVWFDKDGSEYEFAMLKASMPLAPGQVVKNGDNAESGTWSDGTASTELWNVFVNDYGKSNYQWITDHNANNFESYMTDNNWLEPLHLPTFSVGSLMDLGLLKSDAPSSVTMYKNQPLSNTYITITVGTLVQNYLASYGKHSGVYADKDVSIFGATFDFYENGTRIYTNTLAISDLDMGLGEVTKHDGTKGLGIVVKYIYTISGISWVKVYHRAYVFNQIFNKLDVYGA